MAAEKTVDVCVYKRQAWNAGAEGRSLNAGGVQPRADAAQIQISD